MSQTDSSQKIRFKLASGEEFEAEGSLDFIQSQRDYFLTLINKPGPAPAFPNRPRPQEDTFVPGTRAPRLYATAPGSYAYNPARPTPPAPAEEPIPADAKTVFSGKRLWEQLLKTEGDLVFLRRRLRLSPDDGMLLILGGAKELLEKETYSALLLARAAERSGFQITRLDRLLAPAAKLGYILIEGIKRSRTYALTPAGFAHAFMLAQKKVGDSTPLP